MDVEILDPKSRAEIETDTAVLVGVANAFVVDSPTMYEAAAEFSAAFLALQRA